MKLSDECFHCGSVLKRGKASYTATRKGYYLIIDDVPACRWARSLTDALELKGDDDYGI